MPFTYQKVGEEKGISGPCGQNAPVLDRHRNSRWITYRVGDDPYALDHLMDGLRFQISPDDVFDDRVDREKSVSSALTLIGRFTGTDIATDRSGAQHSCIGPTS
ncbi:hypothetical protein ACIBCT_19750 [Streptosporangium sp. NPDC050855]|uniref:hypothetical protein n=1 Tax=Streptosporangium sp. NPDC050855 TaxID=3366194 RepID=UPI0037B2D970